MCDHLYGYYSEFSSSLAHFRPNAYDGLDLKIDHSCFSIQQITLKFDIYNEQHRLHVIVRHLRAEKIFGFF